MTSSSLPQPPRPFRGSSTGHRSSSVSSTSTSSNTRGGGGGALPPPPVVSPGKSAYAQSLARSMTIDEMRHLHARAVHDAEAKQTELRLVLASRYRELVGSSDEVTKMRERAQELHELVNALDGLVEKLMQSSKGEVDNQDLSATVDDTADASKGETKSDEDEPSSEVLRIRRELADLPRRIFRSLDDDNVHEAAVSLLRVFALIASQTDEYLLATEMGKNVLAPRDVASKVDDKLLTAQMRMVFLYLQTLPEKICRSSKIILSSAACLGDGESSLDFDPHLGAERSAAALATLDLLQRDTSETRSPTQVLDFYLESKADLLMSLIQKLSTSSANTESKERKSVSPDDTDSAEAVLSKIVLILQYDIILHPYQMFILRKFPTTHDNSSLMDSLPLIHAQLVQSKISNFLATYLPLIRAKVKTVLVDIAGTTASALGQIRQSLYDKTDGEESRKQLDKSGVCTWEEAVMSVVHTQTVLAATGALGEVVVVTDGLSGEVTNADSSRKFSLWGVLFSNTFSSLVHSLLTTAFQSVHTQVVSTLRRSLAHAPPLSNLLPHEAYRNTLQLATDLNSSLLKVSKDAHELLVHAEERVESERRLQQSLYVQTCEIMGRLLCELRWLVSSTDESNTVKEFIVGRLCYLLKFRLTALATLLDSKCSPAALQRNAATGMIGLIEMSSAFELADDNDDGLITVQEAMEAAESAFSGSHFQGAEMVKETLLLSTSATDVAPTSTGVPPLSSGKAVAQIQNVSLNELALLSARGLRHESAGPTSALGTVQNALDSLIASCMDQWAATALKPLSTSLSAEMKSEVACATTVSDDEYKRMNNIVGASLDSVSPHITKFFLEVSSVLHRSVCPSDALLPVPSSDYAKAMGISIGPAGIPTMMDSIRQSLLLQAFSATSGILRDEIEPLLLPSSGSAPKSLASAGPLALLGLANDISFLNACLRAWYSSGVEDKSAPIKKIGQHYQKLLKLIQTASSKHGVAIVPRQFEESHRFVLDVCSVYMTSLLGNSSSSTANLSALDDMPPSSTSVDSLLRPPITTNCRFSLLPVQSDRTLADIQHRANKLKSKAESESRQDRGSGMVQSGLGFISSMLKKK